MPSINLGRVGFVLRGTWSSQTAYSQLDVVTYNGAAYAARTASTGVTPSSGSSVWQELAGISAAVQSAMNNAAVRFDTAQTLTGAQQTTARTNIDAASTTALGNLQTTVADMRQIVLVNQGNIRNIYDYLFPTMDEVDALQDDVAANTEAIGKALSYKGSAKSADYSGALSNITDKGIYYLSSQTASGGTGNYSDRPVDSTGTAAVLLVYPVLNTFALQNLIDVTGNNYWRYVYQNGTGKYTPSGLVADANGWFLPRHLQQALDAEEQLAQQMQTLSAAVDTNAEAIEKALSYKGKAKSTDYTALLSNITDQGMYYLDRNGATGGTGVFNDRPVDSTGVAAVLLVYPVLNAFALQNLIDVSGNNYWRYVDITNKTPYVPTGLTADTNGWFLPRHLQTALDTVDQLTQQMQTLADAIEANAEAIEKALAYKGAAKSTDYTALLSNVTDTGIYYLNRQATAAGVYDDRPVDSTGSAAVLLVYPVLNAFALQNLIDVSGNNYWRYITLSTKEPYIPSGLTADTNGWFLPRHVQTAMTDIAALQTDTDTLISRQRWAGKTIVFFGDSRTWYDGQPYPQTAKSEFVNKICVGYQQQCVNLLGITAINQGDSGKNTAEISQNIIAYGNGFKNVDAVYISGGVNDFILSRSQIGALDTDGGPYDTGTAYGGLQTAIEWLMTNYPKMKIFVEVPPIAWRGENGEVYPYATACLKKDVAEFYNLPCVDLYKTCGITKFNRSEYYADDPDPAKTNYWYLHFNDYGNERIGQIVAEFINTH